MKGLVETILQCRVHLPDSHLHSPRNWVQGREGDEQNLTGHPPDDCILPMSGIYCLSCLLACLMLVALSQPVLTNTDFGNTSSRF